MSNDATTPPTPRDDREPPTQPSVELSPAFAPTGVGRYRIVRHLADGGMGSVYEAVHEVTRSRAAVKLVKPGFDSREVLARFDAERQVLARFDHPNIARVFDAGVDEATHRPYFAMEYVAEGLPITEFADRERLTIAQRLELFRQACAAIGHAHTKAVIHRDIKPTNVLAYFADGKPTVKVIDFGVAKALTGERSAGMTYVTDAGITIGTYEYMSPEQAEGSGDVDTRTDVYSLGILLYELLAGVRPFDRKELARAADDEIKRVIREVEPGRPSTKLSSLAADTGTKVADQRQVSREHLTRELRRELEWIPLMALRKERGRRYASVEALSADVADYLAGRPLLAAPEGKLYRARKFVRRNRAGVAVSTGFVLLLVCGLAGTSWGLRRAEQQRALAMASAADAMTQKAEAQKQREDALTQAAIAREVSDCLIGMFDAASPERAQGKELTAVEVVTRATSELNDRLNDRDAVKAALENALGRVLAALGRTAEAEPLYKDATIRLRRAVGEDDPDTVSSANNYALALTALGRPAEAEPLLKDALARRRRLLGEGHPETITSLNNYAQVLQMLGRADEAEPLYKDALAQCRRVQGEDHPDTLISINNYASVLMALGRAEEAAPLFQDAMIRFRRVLGDDHPQTLASISNYAYVLEAVGRAADAVPLYGEFLRRSRRVLGEDHPSTITAIANYGSALKSLGRAAEAEPVLKDAMQRFRRVLGEDHPDAISVTNNYALVLAALRRFDEAEPLFKDSLARRRRTLGGQHPDVIGSLANYADMLAMQDRWTEAEPLLKDALARAKAHPSMGPTHATTKGIAKREAVALDKLGRGEESAAIRREFGVAEQTTQPATRPA